MLVTMGGMKKNGEWRVYDYIPFEMLRKQWQTVVLKLIRRALNEQEKRKFNPYYKRLIMPMEMDFTFMHQNRKGM